MDRLALRAVSLATAIGVVFSGSGWAQNAPAGGWAPLGGSAPASPAPAYPVPQGAPQQAAPQPFPAAEPAQEAAPMTAQQLDNLVAPIALYPDELLSQVLAASTYPLEIVDAEQWMQQNKNLPAAQLVNAAKQQNWDPSVQALVAFPDVLDILAHDVHWTTDLGNAFLGQQAEVMSAIQRMRAKAQQNGQLSSGPQQSVTTQYQDGQSAIQIAPADPQNVYVPEYQPQAVYGPPAYGAYPQLWYPPAWGYYGGYGAYPCGPYAPYGPYGCPGIGFSTGVFLGNLFSGLLGFGPWGWGLNWFAHSLFLVPSFFAHFFGGWWGIHGGAYLHGPLYAGHPLWMHDPIHRMGVPYGNRAVAARFGGSFGVRAGGNAVAASRALSASRGEAGRAGAYGGARGVQGRGAEGNRGFSGGSRAPAANQFAGRNYGGQSYGGQSFANRNGGANYGASNYGRAGESYGRGAYGQSFRGATGAGGYSMNRGAQAVRPQARQAAPPQQAPRQNMSRSFSAPSSRGGGSAQHFSAPSGSSHGFSSHGSSSHGSSSHASNHSSGGGHSGGGHSGGHRG